MCSPPSLSRRRSHPRIHDTGGFYHPSARGWNVGLHFYVVIFHYSFFFVFPFLLHGTVSFLSGPSCPTGSVVSLSFVSLFVARCRALVWVMWKRVVNGGPGGGGDEEQPARSHTVLVPKGCVAIGPTGEARMTRGSR